MGNCYTNNHKSTPISKNTIQSWNSAIKKQLSYNKTTFLKFEIKNLMTVNSGLYEITQTDLLNLLKTVLDEHKLNYIITISPLQKKNHFYLIVSIIQFTQKNNKKKLKKCNSVIENQQQQQQQQANNTEYVPMQPYLVPAHGWR